MDEYVTQPKPGASLITKVYESPRIQMGNASDGTWDSSWKLKDGRGERATLQHVKFPEAFKNTPAVIVSMRGIDTYQGNNTRLRISAEDITRDGFNIKYFTWHDTTIWEVSVSWIAIAED